MTDNKGKILIYKAKGGQTAIYVRLQDEAI
jgi:hypothetical protein